MAVIVTISGVMNRMIARTHYRPNSAMDAIVDVRRPDAIDEQKNLVGHEMGGDNEESYHMWYCL